MSCGDADVSGMTCASCGADHRCGRSFLPGVSPAEHRRPPPASVRAARPRAPAARGAAARRQGRAALPTLRGRRPDRRPLLPLLRSRPVAPGPAAPRGAYGRGVDRARPARLRLVPLARLHELRGAVRALGRRRWPRSRPLVLQPDGQPGPRRRPAAGRRPPVAASTGPSCRPGAGYWRRCQLALLALATVLLIGWTRRAYRNLPALDVSGLLLAPPVGRARLADPRA